MNSVRVDFENLNHQIDFSLNVVFNSSKAFPKIEGNAI
jgi:hypothetical protein